MKIGYLVRMTKRRETKFTPKITLAGEYLRRAGFEIGAEYEVRIERGRITCEVKSTFPASETSTTS
jgi:hypothetical protein